MYKVLTLSYRTEPSAIPYSNPRVGSTNVILWMGKLRLRGVKQPTGSHRWQTGLKPNPTPNLCLDRVVFSGEMNGLR